MSTSINNNSALVQVMAWHRSGDKLLSAQIMVLFAEAYIRHYQSWWVKQLVTKVPVIFD